MHLYRPSQTYPEGLAFFAPFLEGHGAFACDHWQDPALTVRIRALNRRFGGLQVSPGLRLACCRRYRRKLNNNTEVPAARDVDGAAPSTLVTS